jgi:hypothetical protein
MPGGSATGGPADRHEVESGVERAGGEAEVRSGDRGRRDVVPATCEGERGVVEALARPARDDAPDAEPIECEQPLHAPVLAAHELHVR